MLGKKSIFHGYVYRVFDFTDNQFVLARDMIVSSDMQSLIVGFLCDFDVATNFKDDSWVDVTGIIEKGNYHGDIAIVKVLDMKSIDEPEDLYVYPPDDTYIPTNNMF